MHTRGTGRRRGPLPRPPKPASPQAYRCEALEGRRLLDGEATVPPPVPPPDPYEPNNTFLTAAFIGLVTGTTRVLAGTNQPGTDEVDYYRFDPVASGQFAAILLTETPALTGSDYVMNLYESDGSFVDDSGAVLPDDQALYADVSAETSYVLSVQLLDPQIPEAEYSLRLTATSPQPDLYEPNDTAALAENLGVVGGSTVSLQGLTNHAANDPDYFRFVVPAGGYVNASVEYEGEDGNVDLFRTDASGNVLATASTTDDDDTLASFLVQPGTIVYLRAVGIGETAGYDLNVYALPIAPDNAEPNNAPTAGLPLPSIGAATVTRLDRTLHAPYDDDYYRFAPQWGGSVTVSLTFTHADGDVDLQLYDAGSGTLLEASGTTTNAESVTYYADRGQALYARVYGFNGQISPDYDLTVTSAVGVADPFEPNDVPASATNLGTVGAAPVTRENATLHLAGQVDWLRFSPATGGTITATVFAPDSADLVLKLYDASLNELASAQSASATDALTRFAPVGGGTYYLRVVGGTASTTANGYDLSVSVTPPAPDAFEPNNTRASASNLGTAALVFLPDLTLHASGNEDWYRLNPANAGPLTATLTSNGAFGNVELQLVGVNGQVLGTSATTNASETLTLPSVTAGGVYYVRAYGATTSTLVSSYSLQLTQAADAAPPVVVSETDLFETAAGVRVRFSEDVEASVSLADVEVRNATTNTILSASEYVVDAELVGSATELSVTLLGPGDPPQDGQYEVRLAGAGISDASGNALGADYVATFRHLGGDANRDGIVNFSDLSVLAVNYGQGGRTWSTGNFDYSAGGTVGFGDLSVLAVNYGTALPLPRPARSSYFSDRDAIELLDERA